jgi:mannan endo-1,4-beta-mannosidase
MMAQYGQRAQCHALTCRRAAVLDGAVRLGYSVLRTWAFNDGGGCNALQTAPGVYDERVFAALDWLLQQCAARGLKLVLVLVNHWDDFGGAKAYVR